MTAGERVRALTQLFREAGIDTARFDARLLVAEVLGVEPGRLVTHPEIPLSPEQDARIAEWGRRRAAREPISHILGRRGFWTLNLAVSAHTLDPRPDTETLVQAVLDAIPDKAAALSLVDFGTGTGAILLALLSELPNATGLGIDKSEQALDIARANAESTGLASRARFQLGDWGRGLAGRFNVIVSNPPYIPEGEIDGLEPEVARYEPRLALAGGPDGLDCYRALAPQAAALLAPGGVVAFEVGAGQAADVGGLLEQAGLTLREVRSDLGGVERVVVAQPSRHM